MPIKTAPLYATGRGPSNYTNGKCLHPLKGVADLRDRDGTHRAMYRRAQEALNPASTLLQAFYSILSERLLMEPLEYELLFRWFVGIGHQDLVGTGSAQEGPGTARSP
jgi:hypothetical protein